MDAAKGAAEYYWQRQAAYLRLQAVSTHNLISSSWEKWLERCLNIVLPLYIEDFLINFFIQWNIPLGK